MGRTSSELDVPVSAQFAVKSIVSPVRPSSKSPKPSKMKHLAAYLLLGLGGNSDPSVDDIKGVLSSVGIDADDERLDKLIEELKGKDINELISEGSSKLASVPSGGAGGAEEEKPAEKEEEKEESDEDMGFGLFD